MFGIPDFLTALKKKICMCTRKNFFNIFSSNTSNIRCGTVVKDFESEAKTKSNFQKKIIKGCFFISKLREI